MPNNFSACALTLALSIGSVGMIRAQSSIGPPIESQIVPLKQEINRLEARREQVRKQINLRSYAPSNLKELGLATIPVVVVSVLFLIYIRRQVAFDRPVRIMYEGKKHVFPFEAYKKDEKGEMRHHYGCPACAIQTLRKSECRDHLKEKHQAVLGQYAETLK